MFMLHICSDCFLLLRLRWRFWILLFSRKKEISSPVCLFLPTIFPGHFSFMDVCYNAGVSIIPAYQFIRTIEWIATREQWREWPGFSFHGALSYEKCRKGRKNISRFSSFRHGIRVTIGDRKLVCTKPETGCNFREIDWLYTTHVEEGLTLSPMHEWKWV